MITMITVQKAIQLSQILQCKLKYVKDKLINNLCCNQGINKWQTANMETISYKCVVHIYTKSAVSCCQN